MKNILLFSLLFCAIVMPTHGELTVQDTEKIRSIVKESEVRVKEHVDLKVKNVSDKVVEMDKRLNLIFWLVIALIGLIAVVVGIPQILVAASGKEQKALATKIEDLQKDISNLKQDRLSKAHS